MSETGTAVRHRRPRRTFDTTVVATQRLGTHLVRVVAEGESLATFGDPESATLPHTDSYVKIAFGDVTRTYTVRAFDRQARRITIDFVVHGDEGLAGPWANRAQPGAQLSFMGPGGGYAPDPDATWHVFAGDLSAFPAIAGAVEALPAHARGIALIETPDGELPKLKAPSGVEVRRLTNPGHDPEVLGRALAELDWPEPIAGVQVFAHGERESIKAARRILRDRKVPRERISISGYWAHGRAEDAFQAEKRQPIGQIEP